MEEGRMTGETTRLVDQAIQNYFINGVADVIDHYPSNEATRYLLDRICNRLSFEHRHQNNIDYTIDSLRVGKNSYFKIVKL